jgi:hypothetical protein
MHDLAIIVAVMFLAMICTGPLAIWLAVNKYELGSLFMAALALMFGIHWFINIQTSIRFLGMAVALLGVFAIWYSVRLTR